MSTDVTTAECSLSQPRRSAFRWILGLSMVAVLALGWEYPLFGFAVPVAMVAGIGGGFLRGRWVCGNLCPRGSFLDTWYGPFSARRKNPEFLQGAGFRWGVCAALMGFMVYRLAQAPGDIQHWGLVFWQMCLITTVVALVLGPLLSARSWCGFCPVGTMSGSIGGDKQQLRIDAACQTCNTCEQHCPMQLDISKYRLTGRIDENDCIRCSTCQQVCPQGDVLSWPERDAA